ncbi:PTS glucose transporter subunit IIA [Cutibacterium sp. WCA-380-WT-3A]|uniref:PTS glucose transporter subunit IIA n=1 Tax=Cutibacterium porci TaxID=2605781 RepID=A0A7K0JA49_9ACTN|nr:PTS glucose transporter subunit IIA [Cutibacterium porci]MSS46628.1 PTS glucose transporter subunit IIA [Cutibacterium porci]
MASITAPLDGTVMALSEVPDPVFAQGLVGPGIAMMPTSDGDVTVVAPAAGRIVKLHPHAFVIQTETFGLLVHLGIDTVQLDGEGFTLHAVEGDEVAVGDPLITWNPAKITQGGRSVVCPIVILDVPADKLEHIRPAGESAQIGEPLLTVA